MAYVVASNQGSAGGPDNGNHRFYICLELWYLSTDSTGYWLWWRTFVHFDKWDYGWDTAHGQSGGMWVKMDGANGNQNGPYSTGWSAFYNENRFIYDYGQFHVNFGDSCSAVAQAWYASDGGNYYYSYGSTVSYTVPRPTYTIAYNANGGSGAPGNQTKTYGYNLTLSSTVPTRTGYRFDGWATNSSGAVAYQPGGTYSANFGVTLYAHWTALYTVAYNGNGAISGSTASQTKVAGVNLTLQQNGFVRTGYSFKRWNTNTVDTGTAYNAGGIYSANAAVLLYAIWNRTVTYSLNGASGTAPSAQTTIATSVITLASAPTRENFVFVGWNTAADSSGTMYDAESTYAENQPSITLYAIWHRMVSFDSNGHDVEMPDSIISLATDPIELPTEEEEEYTFNGWNTEADGTGDTYIESYPVELPSRTLYARWVKTPIMISVVRVNEDDVEDDAGGYTRVVWSIDSDYPVLSSSCSANDITVSEGEHSTDPETITSLIGDGTDIYPLTEYTVTGSITTIYGTATASIILPKADYAMPTIDIHSVKRVQPFDGVYEDDVLGTYLQARITYSIQETPTQKVATSLSHSFAIAGPNSVGTSELELTEDLVFLSNQFTYDDIHPNDVVKDVISVTLSDKFYTVTETMDLETENYVNPSITSVSTARALPSGALDEIGTSALVTVNCRSFLSKHNAANTQLVIDAFLDNEIVATKTVNINDYVTGNPVAIPVLLNQSSGVEEDWEGFDLNLRYTARAILTDILGRVLASAYIRIAYITMDVQRGGHGVSFGTESISENFNVSMPQMAWRNPDMSVMTFTNRAVAEAALETHPECMPCTVLCLDEWTWWHCEIVE